MLREAVRAEAKERTWSQGVTLARDQRVLGRGRSGDELELDVRVPGRPTPFHVVLNPAHGEWECDCPSKESVCSHVVAAVLAVEQNGEQPLSARVNATIRYLLEPDPAGVRVSRLLVYPDRTEPLSESLMTIVGTGRGAAIATENCDLIADSVIGNRTAPITGDKVDRLFTALAEARDIRWCGQPVSTSGDAILPRAVVADHYDGVRVRIEADPTVEEVVTVGVVRTAENVLRPIGAIDLSGARLDKLPQQFEVARSALPELVRSTLPALAQRMPVEVRARSLPNLDRTREQPRMQLDVVQDGDTLTVFPTLVYGDPPRARVDGRSLVHLGGALPFRDEDAEKRLVHRLRDELNLVPGRRVQLVGREAFQMQQGLASWLRSDARAAGDSKLHPLDVKIAIEGNRLDVSMVGASGAKTASIGAALRAWQAGLDVVPLEGGGWGRVPKQWFDTHGGRLADLLAARSSDHKIPIFALPDLAKLCEDLDEPPPPQLERLRPLLSGFEGIPSVPVAEGFVGELRPYQQRGVDWLAFCREAGLGCVLADDMGLGKTIQALAGLQGRTLVVCPKSVLFNWRSEIQRFRPDLKIANYSGAKRTLDLDADLIITSYPMLRNDVEVLSGPTWDVVILDESQTIKNPDSQVARAAYKLKAGWKLTLSGTPVENRLDELWSQLHFTNPGLLGGRADFQERWAEPINLGDQAAAARLRDRIRPFVLRRMKREVAKELPARTDAVMYVELDEAERVTYDAIRAATQSEIVKLLEAGGGVMAALEALLRLRQAACHTALLPDALRSSASDRKAGSQEGAGASAAPLRSSKLDRLMEAIEDVVADGHRALVFSQWTSLLDLIEGYLHTAKVKFVRLDGSTTDRAAVVNEFQAEEGPPIMLLSLKAGGTGLNLTAADHVFLVDPWWNPAVEDQAADRAHRIGQDKPVMVYRMVARDTVEERILELQARKRKLADAALSEAGAATAITRSDLLALLA